MSKCAACGYEYVSGDKQVEIRKTLFMRTDKTRKLLRNAGEQIMKYVPSDSKDYKFYATRTEYDVVWECVRERNWKIIKEDRDTVPAPTKDFSTGNIFIKFIKSCKSCIYLSKTLHVIKSDSLNLDLYSADLTQNSDCHS